MTDAHHLIAADDASLIDLVPLVDGEINRNRLFAGSGVTVTLMAIGAGAELTEHKAPARIIIRGVSGHIDLTVGGEHVDLVEGTEVFADPDVLHALSSRDGGRFMLTILRDAD